MWAPWGQSEHTLSRPTYVVVLIFAFHQAGNVSLFYVKKSVETRSIYGTRTILDIGHLPKVLTWLTRFRVLYKLHYNVITYLINKQSKVNE